MPNPLPVLEDLTNKFRCQIPHQGIVQPSASVGHLFMEFYISTTPDTEDFKSEHDEEIPGAESQEEYLSNSDTNFIEQCHWGYSKRLYRLNPESSREDHLERNMLAALEAVPLQSMRKFATRSQRFMDAYARGLNGRQAAWAARKYRGHRVLPEGILEELDKEHIVWSNDHWFLSDGDQNTILQVLRLIQFTPDGHKDLSLFNKLIYLYKLGLKCI